ncbi:RNA polymerase sigma factor [candidate division WWE3 bacterium]|nr:RNA polymerase sigma factor [candidate division WWE3 bacterium]
MIKWIKSRMYPLSDKSDAELIAAAKRGDRDAFGQLYLRHLDAMFRYIYFRTGDSLTAEQIAADVFVKAWKKLESYHPKAGSSFTSWIYRIARNRIIDYYRTRNTRNQSLSIQMEDAHQLTFDERLAKIDNERMIEQSLQILTEEQREVIMLKYIERLDYKEICSITGKSNMAVRALVSRGLKILQKNITKK